MKRTTYVYSKNRDYLEDEYVNLFSESNAYLEKGTIEDLNILLSNNPKMLQLDTETNVVKHYSDRELYVVQIGNIEGTKQFIFDIQDLDKETEEKLISILSDKDITFLAHNAQFEYIVINKHFGIKIKNFMDTFLMSKIITSGLDLESGYNSLANLLKVNFGIDMSKAEQTTFTGEKMSPEQLLYATTDVLYLYDLYEKLYKPIKRWKLTKILKLENASLRAIAEMTINGFLINTDALDENIELYDKAADTAKQEMIDFIKNSDDATLEKLREINVIQKEDEILINWNSSVQKRLILKHLYKDIEISSTAKKALTKLQEEVDNPTYLEWLLNGNTDRLEDILISRHMDFLKENDMFIAKGTLNLNFNSPAQLLDFFRIWYPNLNSVGVKALKKLKHPIVNAYKKYAKAQKLVSSFGRKMYTYIEKDGRIHTSFTQLVPTGSRMSSNNPNMQQAPSTEQYRRMFIPTPGWKLIDSDYSSAELYIAAYLSQDPKMLEAIKKGYDLHSYSAYQIFGQAWLDAGGEKEPVGKPKTPEANAMRKKSKGASFSILYGTGVTAFSENNGMTLAEGKVVLKAYYDTFPKLVSYFKRTADLALHQYYVRESVFGRIRFFNKPKNGMEVSHIKNAAMNYKPQSINGSIMKYALAKMFKYIEDHNLYDKVRLLITVHDQQVSEAREDFAEEWSKIQTKLMEEAALYVIPDGSLKVDTNILDHWTK